MREKKFQLYFAGSQNKQSEVVLQELNVNRLASQFLDRLVIADWIRARSEGKAQGHLFIDSGAFSAHTKGIKIDVDEYIAYVNGIDEHVHLIARLDVIPGEYRKKKSPEQLAEAPKLSWANYLYMRRRLKSPDKLLPIFHQGEDFKWLENMLEATFNGKHIEYIGISPANDMSLTEKEKFIDQCFKIIQVSSNPNVQTHAFGTTSMPLLNRYPFTSADATTWIMCGAMGSIMSKYGNVCVSSGRTYANEHINRMPKAAQKEIEDYVLSHGYTLEGLADDYKQRIEFNIKYLNEWSHNYELKYSSVTRTKLF